MKKTFKVDTKTIGDEKTFVIAEIELIIKAILRNAKLIKAASICGADAAKIQLVNVHEL